jgi:hypothetical protein
MALGESTTSAVGTTNLKHLTLGGWFRREQWHWDFNLVPSFVWFYRHYGKNSLD